MFSLLLKEIRSFLSSLIGYIVISVFLLLIGLFTWVFQGDFNILDLLYADMKGFFQLGPLVFMFLIPAITMRSFSEEKRTGTIELLFTKPLSDLQIILSKYFASLILVLFAILPTLTYYYSIYQLGDPVGNIDTGQMWGSYIGLLLMGSGFVSIGIFCSAITPNQIVSFIVAVFLSFFFYVGFDFIGSYSMFGTWDSIIRFLGINEHYQSLSRGVLDTRDILYFISLNAFFIILTKINFERKIAIQFPIHVISIAIFIVLNMLGAYYYNRFDLTQDKRYTLNDNTVKFVKENIKDKITFTIYLTGEVPAELKRIEREIEEKLADLRAHNSLIQYEFVDPYDFEDETERNNFMQQLTEQKLKFSKLMYEEDGGEKFKYLFTAAKVTYLDKEMPLQFFHVPVIYQNFDLRGLSEYVVNNLELQFVDIIRKIIQKEKPQIGILTGHGEPDKERTFIFENALSDFYSVSRVQIDLPNDSIGERPFALRDYQGLIICQPDSSFTEKEKFIIDQFIMKGGKVAWMVDPIHVYEDTLWLQGQTFGLAKRLRFEDMLFNYGVRINKDLVLDHTAAPIEIPGYPGKFHEWYFYPYVLPNRDHPITKSLDPIKLEYASSLDFVGSNPNIKKTVLLSSSENSTTYKAPVRVNYGFVEQEMSFTNNRIPNIPLAVLLEGEFESAYKGLMTQQWMNSKDYVTKDRSVKTKMIVIGDGDIMLNEVDSVMNQQSGRMEIGHMKLHVDKYHVKNNDGTDKYVYGNLEFLLNSMDYLMNNEEIISLRARTITFRRLNEEKVIKDKRYWQFFNVALPVFLVILFGIFQHYYRVRKYTK
jgi:ABC-2 type transport system permease protein